MTLTPRILIQTLSGRMVDIIRPLPADVDFAGDIAPRLSRIPRFNAATLGPVNFTVAQHCIWGCDWLASAHRDAQAFRMKHGLRREADLRLARAAYLLHDAHEAWIGDIISPVAQAIAAHADLEWSDAKPQGHRPGFLAAIGLKRLKHVCDGAIFRAAGMPWPLPAHVAEAVRELDLRAMVTERNHLMAKGGHWGPLERLQPCGMKGALVPEKSAAKLACLWLERLDELCPEARPRASAAELAAFVPSMSRSHA